MKAVRSIACGGLAAILLTLVPFGAQAQSEDRKMRPPCKMSDNDVERAGDGWSGPKCITVDALGQPLPAALAAEKDRVARLGKEDAAAAKPAGAKPLCKLGDPGVTMTPRGWAGPNCIEADALGRPVTKP